MNTNPYQKAIDEAIAGGEHVSACCNAYKLLFKLCRVKGLEMNGNKTAMAKKLKVTPKSLVEESKRILRSYIETGEFVVPCKLLK